MIERFGATPLELPRPVLADLSDPYAQWGLVLFAAGAGLFFGLPYIINKLRSPKKRNLI